MPPIKLLNLFALSSLAIFFCALGVAPANALSAENHRISRHVAHEGIAKKKRSTKQKRCIDRTISSAIFAPSSSPASSPSSEAPPASTPASSTPVSSAPPASSSPSTPPPPPPPSSGRGKHAVAWALGEDSRLGLLNVQRTHYAIPWSPRLPNQLANLPGLEGVPMLWGRDQAQLFQQLVVAGYANVALAFNEVNEPGQANMSPEEAVGLWRQYMSPLRNLGYRLGSPSTSSNPNGLVWVKNFVNLCPDCEFDITPIHWYDVSFEGFKTYVNLWHDTFGKLIWITEFAVQNFNGGAQPSNDQIWNFYIQAIPWLDANPAVEVYAPFGWMDDMYNVNYANRLFDGNQPSALGWMFLNGVN